MNEYLSFKKMISPVIIQGLFWLGVVVVVISGLTAMFSYSFLIGLLIIIVGPLVVRIYCELLIVLFQINNTLNEIKNVKSGL